jgi:4-carboxymuconolactone decarboxylase
MARTPVLTRDDVPENLREAFDHETANSGGVVASGPGSAMINSPEMRRRANHLVFYLREASVIPKKLQELIMILTARSMDCLFIWNAHAAGARREGISDAYIDALRDKKPLPSLPADEQLIADYVLQSFQDHRVSQSTFEAVVKEYGAQGATEISTWMGFYTMLAFNVNAFDVELPQDHSEPALPV